MSPKTTHGSLFDPKVAGWEQVDERGNIWRHPGGRWRYWIHGKSHALEIRVAPNAGSKFHYTGAHPTQLLVEEVIRINGGDNSGVGEREDLPEV